MRAVSRAVGLVVVESAGFQMARFLLCLLLLFLRENLVSPLARRSRNTYSSVACCQPFYSHYVYLTLVRGVWSGPSSGFAGMLEACSSGLPSTGRGSSTEAEVYRGWLQRTKRVTRFPPFLCVAVYLDGTMTPRHTQKQKQQKHVRTPAASICVCIACLRCFRSKSRGS